MGGAGLGIVAWADGAFAMGKPVIAADADPPQAFRRIDRRAIGKLKQREPRSRFDESVGQIAGAAAARGNRRVKHGSARPRAVAPRIAIGGRKPRVLRRGNPHTSGRNTTLAEI